MRETLWFVASLAGAAILTALAVIVSPQSPLWRDVLIGGAYILLVCAVLIFFDMRQPLKERPKMMPLIGMVICGVGFLGCMAWYFWPSPQREAPLLQTQEATQPGGAQKQVSLLWECQAATLPNVVPNGGVNTIEITIDDDGTNPHVDFVVSNAPPGSPYRKGRFIAEKCSLINFGDETIFDIPIGFNVSFTRVSDERDGIKNVVAKGHSPNLPIRSLDRGRDNSYTIYIINLSRKFAVDIELPTTASYVTVGDSTRKEAKFLPLGVNESFMTLFPATH
jgi:hypothetical protein